MYSPKQRQAIYELCKAGTKVEVPQHPNGLNARMGREQVAYFKFWTNDGGKTARAYLNVKTVGSDRFPATAGYVNLRTGEIVIDNSGSCQDLNEKFWNDTIALFSDLIVSEAA